MDRQSYLQRQINYWSGSGATLVLIDGSLKPAEFLMEPEFTQNVTYVHRPESIWNRLQLASELVATKYCALIPDDEFFIKSAVAEFIDLMERSSEIDAVLGSTIRFSFRHPLVHASETYTSFRNIEGPKRLGFPGIEQFWNDENYVVHFPIYSIMRSSAFEKMSSIAFRRDFGNAYAHEVLFNLVFPFHFYSVLIPTLYWLRSDENLPLSSASFDRSVRFSTWFTDPANENERVFFLESVVSAFIDDPRSDAEKTLFVQNLLEHFSNRDIERRKNEPTHLIDLAAYHLRVKGYSWLPKARRFPFPKSFLRLFGYEQNEITSLGKKLQKKGLTVDQDELVRISQLVRYFHKKVNL
jgi:hypothetical protein